jgi:hypothetical protein
MPQPILSPSKAQKEPETMRPYLLLRNAAISHLLAKSYTYTFFKCNNTILNSIKVQSYTFIISIITSHPAYGFRCLKMADINFAIDCKRRFQYHLWDECKSSPLYFQPATAAQSTSCFRGLEVTFPPHDPIDAGSNPAEVVEFLRTEKFRERSPTGGTLSRLTRVVDLLHVKEPQAPEGDHWAKLSVFPVQTEPPIPPADGVARSICLP